MINPWIRSSYLLGEDAIKTLKNKSVAVFGLGGVGSYAVEALARSGIGSLTLVDHDVVSLSNINRQLGALHSTIGQLKVEVAKKRIVDINPDCQVYTYSVFADEKTLLELPFQSFDYVVDAIDTITSKILIIEQAKKHHCKIISAMGAGNKLDPTKFEVVDITKTTMCPLAKVMRIELKKRNISDVKVVYSKERAMTPIIVHEDANERKRMPIGSVAFVPSVAGLILAGEVIKDFVQCKKQTSS